MKVLCIVLVALVATLVAVGSSPLFARKFTDWRNPRTPASYRERLQSWGLYPKVFRYGTTHHQRAMAMSRKKDEVQWMKRLVREHEAHDGSRIMASNGRDEIGHYGWQYEKLKEKLVQKMEQDAQEILWQHR